MSMKEKCDNSLTFLKVYFLLAKISEMKILFHSKTEQFIEINIEVKLSYMNLFLFQTFFLNSCVLLVHCFKKLLLLML